MSDILSLEIVTDTLTIQPGQAIACEYTAASNALGTFSNLGNATKDIIQNLAAPDGSFYFICVGYTPQGYPKLIADRNIQTNISYDTLSELGTSFGKETTIGSNSFRVRLLESAFLNDGNYSGEYDKIILDYDLGGKISKADVIWNTNVASWSKTTPTSADSAGTAAAVTQMIARGGSTPQYITNVVTTVVSATVGFRPVLTIIPKKYTRGNIGCSLPLVTNMDDIVPGKAISCEYTASTSGQVGTFSNLGKATKDPISDLSSSTPDGTFYLICIGYTASGYPKLIADRNIQTSISWDVLQTAGFCESSGSDKTIDGTKVKLRILNTVSARHPSISDYGEWDAIISLYDTNNILASSNDIWNCKETLSWTTGSLYTIDDVGTLASPSLRIARGMQDSGYVIESQRKFDSSQTLNYVGFRPVLIYTAIPSNSRGRVGTTLPLASKLNNIVPGQAISCEYKASSGLFGTFSNLGSATKQNILDMGEEAPNGTFYFICIGYTPDGHLKFVADRNIQTNITWDTLNDAGMCLTTGSPIVIGNKRGGLFMRLMSTLADRTLSASNYGEWDAIISYLNKYDISASDNNIWNCKNNASWTIGNISTTDDAGTVAGYEYKIGRGNQDTGFIPSLQAKYLATYSSESIGFRPVIYYNPALASNSIVTPIDVSPTHIYDSSTTISTEVDTDSTSGYFKTSINGIDRSGYGELQDVNIPYIVTIQPSELNNNDNIIQVVFKDQDGVEDKSPQIIIKKEIPYRTEVNRTFKSYDGGYTRDNITFNGQAKISTIYTGSVSTVGDNKFSIPLNKYIDKIGVV
jgi:hypothetical protein